MTHVWSPASNFIRTKPFHCHSVKKLLQLTFSWQCFVSFVIIPESPLYKEAHIITLVISSFHLVCKLMKPVVEDWASYWFGVRILIFYDPRSVSARSDINLQQCEPRQRQSIHCHVKFVLPSVLPAASKPSHTLSNDNSKLTGQKLTTSLLCPHWEMTGCQTLLSIC